MLKNAYPLGTQSSNCTMFYRNAFLILYLSGSLMGTRFNLTLRRGQPSLVAYLSVCRQLKLIWPSTNKKRTLDLFFLKRNNIFEVIRVLTGHWLLGKHRNRLVIITSQSCRSCGDTDDGETTEIAKILQSRSKMSSSAIVCNSQWFVKKNFWNSTSKS